MMNPKYLISGAAAAMVVVGGLAYAQTSDPMAAPTATDSQAQATQQQPGSTSSDGTTGSMPNTTDAPATPTGDALNERAAQADRN